MAYIVRKSIIKPRNVNSASLCYIRTFHNSPNLASINNTQEHGFAKRRSVAAFTEKSDIFVNQAKPASEIPGPKSFPIIGCALALLMQNDFDKNRTDIFWKNVFKKYGPIAQLKFPGRKPIVALFRPEDFETLYKATADNPIRDALLPMKIVREQAIDNYFEKNGGILPENHEEWWRVRSRVQTPMMKPKIIHTYLSQMDDVVLDFMDRISDLQKQYGEMPTNFQEEIYKFALESVGLVALNRRLGCLNPNLSEDSLQMSLIHGAYDIFDSLNNMELGFHLWRFFPSPSFRKFKKAHDIFLKVAMENMERIEKELNEKVDSREIDAPLSIVESLLRTNGLSRKDIVTMTLDMLAAGIDTTSHCIGFTLYLLAKNPDAQKKLQKEVDEVLGDGKGHLTSAHLKKLSYLKACVKESLRIFPVTLGTVRTLENDTVLCGYTVPKGYQVLNIMLIAGWDEQNFERVDKFLPERWSRDRPLGNIHPYAALPFSIGTRMCIGRRIAEQEIYTFLARTFHRYNIEYHYEDMGMETRLVFKPSKPLKFKFTKRIKNL